MNSYNIYGVGNALVDLEYNVSSETLDRLGIEKGVMTLIDEVKQAEVVAALDGAECHRACGGSAANTVVAIAQMGGTGFFSCRIGDDETGKFYLEDLTRFGIATNITPPETLNFGTTGKCLVLVTPDADRTMNTFLGVSADISIADLEADSIAASDYVYIEGYLVSSDSARATAIRARELARENGTKVAFTLSDPNMVKFFKTGLLEIIGDGVDLLFANETEALEMAGTDSIEAAIAYLKTIAQEFVITLGPKGSLIYDGATLHQIAPCPVTAIDTVGAGDMYAGAFLYGITHGMDYAIAGDLASRASAKIVTKYGPRLSDAEIQALLASS
jgi:sugar/nucleoside kinase (ribokinase family)